MDYTYAATTRATDTEQFPFLRSTATATERGPFNTTSSSNNNRKPPAAAALNGLAEVLPRTKIQRLGLAHLNLTDGDLQPLMTVLPKLPKMECLDLSSNQITFLGARALVESQKKAVVQQHVLRVDLGFNPISDEEAQECQTLLEGASSPLSCGRMKVNFASGCAPPPKPGGNCDRSCDQPEQPKTNAGFVRRLLPSFLCRGRSRPRSMAIEEKPEAEQSAAAGDCLKINDQMA